MTGLTVESQTPLTNPEQIQAPFADALVDLAARRPDVVVLSADLSNYTDLRPFATTYPDRFIQVGMAEANMMGIAGGLARSGFLPIAVTYGVFATRRAYDQVAMALATGGVHAIVVAFLPGITTPFRATHQATDDLALMRAIPGMTVIDPADATEVASSLHAAADYQGPIYIRGLRGLVDLRFPPEEFVIGRARRVRTGHDALVIGTGLGTAWALDAAQIASQSGVEATVLHSPTLKPFDDEFVRTACEGFTSIHVVENHSTVGGLADAVASALARAGRGVRVIAHGVPDVWAPAGSLDHVRAGLGLDAHSLASAITREVGRT
jgi:transketolase